MQMATASGVRESNQVLTPWGVFLPLKLRFVHRERPCSSCSWAEGGEARHSPIPVRIWGAGEQLQAHMERSMARSSKCRSTC